MFLAIKFGGASSACAENQRILWKNVSYPCHVTYIYIAEHFFSLSEDGRHVQLEYWEKNDS